MLIRFGRYAFRHRNWMFPVIVGVLFAIATPPAELLGSQTLEREKDTFAILLALTGLTLRALVIGFAHIRRAGQERSIHADTLLTRGMFSLCRNPLYTGNILGFLALFLMHGSIWTVVLGSGSYLLIYYSIVQAEEIYLLARFGEPYAEYRAEVPRWLPDLTHVRAAFAGMRFSIRRVLLVEYPNIGINIIALAATEFYRRTGYAISRDDLGILAVPAGVMLAAGVWVGAIRLAKKRRYLVAE